MIDLTNINFGDKYIAARNYKGFLAHKGNCKYCKERREKELKELVEQIKEK
jgi:hypothetical protein